jgi:hypothetical protein
MKRLITLVCFFATLTVAAANPPEVNEKVLKAFEQTFVSATEVVWHERENTYEARFKQSAIITRASYDKEGNLLYTTRYYGEEMLPINVLTKLKKKFVGKSVYGVTESANENDVNYHIVLQDEKNWYIIKADGFGSMELFKKYKKA